MEIIKIFFICLIVFIFTNEVPNVYSTTTKLSKVIEKTYIDDSFGTLIGQIGKPNKILFGIYQTPQLKNKFFKNRRNNGYYIKNKKISEILDVYNQGNNNVYSIISNNDIINIIPKSEFEKNKLLNLRIPSFKCTNEIFQNIVYSLFREITLRNPNISLYLLRHKSFNSEREYADFTHPRKISIYKKNLTVQSILNEISIISGNSWLLTPANKCYILSFDE